MDKTLDGAAIEDLVENAKEQLGNASLTDLFRSFVFLDKNANERQSDDVEFCIIPEFHNNKIYFYYSEYALFWDSIETVGDFNKTLDIILKGRIIPATLDEIADNDLIHYIDTVKEYDTDTKKITYIHLK